METHRQEVREAILDATASLVQSRGLLAVTMSDIAEETGIGRATLYKYFPDVETILSAWHQRQVEAHLAELNGSRSGQPIQLLVCKPYWEGTPTSVGSAAATATTS